MAPASVKVEPGGGHRSIKVIITLAHADTEDLVPKRTLHKLDVDAKPHDVRPPIGIQRHELETVRIDVQLFQAKSATKLRGLSTEKYAAAGVATSTDEPTTGVGGSDPDAFSDLEDTAPCHSSSTTGCARDSVGFNKPTSTDFRLAGHNNLNTAPHSYADPPSRRQNDTDAFGSIAPVSSRDCIVEMASLVAAAVRLSIAPLSRRLPKHPKLLETESIEHLSDFAPAVFRPGYLPAVAARSRFLPTLNHALARFGTNAVSADLRAKLARTAHPRYRPGPGSVSATSAPVANSTAMDAYMSSLWNIVGTSLRYPDRSRQLSSFRQALSSHGGHEFFDIEWDSTGAPEAADQERGQGLDGMPEHEERWVCSQDSRSDSCPLDECHEQQCSTSWAISEAMTDSTGMLSLISARGVFQSPDRPCYPRSQPSINQSDCDEELLSVCSIPGLNSFPPGGVDGTLPTQRCSNSQYYNSDQVLHGVGHRGATSSVHE